VKALPAEFFTRFGLLAERDFLSPTECAVLRDEMRAAEGAAATVADGEEGEAVDETYRRTKQMTVPTSTAEAISVKLLGILPALATHFDRKLVGIQPPQFLLYREGDFFRAHPDNSTDPNRPEFVRQRSVSAVVFLNGNTPGEPDGYSGGTLVFHNLMDDTAAGESVGLPLLGEAGLLIAFPSELVHAVSPVTSGERYTLVSWFY
jgi:predicted 2-oxoglutarate/Fe(II)-dependent dioxygenase YbiX